MKKMVFLLAMVACIRIAEAALAPRYQNEKDLDVMVAYIKNHPTILSGLRSIDFRTYSVYFGDDCVAEFGRDPTPRPAGWVGPADRLEFKSCNCPVD